MAILKDFIDIVGEDHVKEQERMSEHTTFRIGGPAKLFITPSDLEEFEQVLRLAKASGEPYLILGNGSNLLVKDTGYEGIVIATHGKEKGDFAGSLGLQEFREISGQEAKRFLEQTAAEGEKFHAPEGKRLVLSGNGILLPALASGIAALGLSGFEFASGIPGTLGGAVTMNAGAYGGEMKDVLLGAVLLTKDGQRLFLQKEELELGYRSSRVQREELVVLCAILAFSEGDEKQIRGRMRELNERRREKQPLQYGSAGSTFKRPEGYFAGKLIEDAGLKGYRVGDVMVSEKHAGFVVNVGEGTYEQAMAVIRHVQEGVQEKFGVVLETEVKLV